MQSRANQQNIPMGCIFPLLPHHQQIIFCLDSHPYVSRSLEDLLQLKCEFWGNATLAVHNIKPMAGVPSKSVYNLESVISQRKQPMTDWIHNFPDAVTVCNLQGIVLDLNEKAAAMFHKYGGKELIGKSLLDCHPEPARSKLLQLLQSGERNVYTIEKNGIHKLIYQAPWYHNGQRCGMVELALETPPEMPHFVRG
jgi:transcriptional regulator with PAS, ATPase and Fis domain